MEFLPLFEQPKSEHRIVGIVGSEAAKFNWHTEMAAKKVIHDILSQFDVYAVSSGHCHLGGIDIWAEEIAMTLGLESFIYPPPTKSWETGYKLRNLQIVNKSTEIHCITIKDYPPEYNGMRFNYCYHCKANNHIKSGGCWTAKQAQKIGKPAYWHYI